MRPYPIKGKPGRPWSCRGGIAVSRYCDSVSARDNPAQFPGVPHSRQICWRKGSSQRKGLSPAGACSQRLSRVTSRTAWGPKVMARHLSVTLPITKVKRVVVNADVADFKCAICFGIVKKAVVVKACEHLFCGECLDDWVRNNKSCPVDRASLKTSDLVEPSRFFRNQYNRLKMKLRLCRSMELLLLFIK